MVKNYIPIDHAEKIFSNIVCQCKDVVIFINLEHKLKSKAKLSYCAVHLKITETICQFYLNETEKKIFK